MSKILKKLFSFLYKDKNKKHFFIIPLLFFISIATDFINTDTIAYSDVVFINIFTSLSHLYIGLVLFKTIVLSLNNLPTVFKEEQTTKNVKYFFFIYRMVIRKIKVIASNNNFKKRFYYYFTFLVFSAVFLNIIDAFQHYNEKSASLSKEIHVLSNLIKFTLFIYCFVPLTLIVFIKSHDKFKYKHFKKFLCVLFVVAFMRLLDLPSYVNSFFVLSNTALYVYVLALLFVSISYEIKANKLDYLLNFINDNKIETSETMKNKIKQFKTNGFFKEFFAKSLSSTVNKEEYNSYIEIYMNMLIHNIDLFSNLDEISLRQKMFNYHKQLEEKNKELEEKTFDYIH
jgi:hypothetical protein